MTGNLLVDLILDPVATVHLPTLANPREKIDFM